MTQLTNLKDYILANYPEYNKGFANVSKPDGTEIVIDENMNYAGIADNLGNYFYIRSLKEKSYKPFSRGCRVLSYEVTTKCRLVSIFHQKQDEAHLQNIINAISYMGHVVDKSDGERTKVFFDETGTRNMNDNLKNLSLLSIDFTVTELVSAKNCKPPICEC